jgi:hypothetical protein
MISQYFTRPEFCLFFPSHSNDKWYCPKRRGNFDGQTCIRDAYGLLITTRGLVLLSGICPRCRAVWNCCASSPFSLL